MEKGQLLTLFYDKTTWQNESAQFVGLCCKWKLLFFSISDIETAQEFFCLRKSILVSFGWNSGTCYWNALSITTTSHRCCKINQDWTLETSSLKRITIYISAMNQITTCMCNATVISPCDSVLVSFISLFWFYSPHLINSVFSWQLCQWKHLINPLHTTCPAPSIRQTKLVTSWWTQWSI